MTTIPFLPPSSRLTRLSRVAAWVARRRPVSVLPVKLITGTSGLATIASPTSAPGPVTRLTVPGREAGLGHQLDQERGAVGRVARRLEHDGVAADQGRHHLPARDRHREVPGGDDPGDPDRLADRHRPLVGQLGRASYRRTAGGPRRPSGRRCRCPPGRRLGPRPGPCPSRGSSPGPGAPCARPAAPRSGTGSRPAWGRESGARRRRPSRRPGSPGRRRPPCRPGSWPTRSRVSAGLRLSNVRPLTESTHSPAMNSWYVGSRPRLSAVVMPAPARRPSPPSHRRPGTGSPGRSGRRAGRAHGAGSRRSGRRSRRSDGRGRSLPR